MSPVQAQTVPPVPAEASAPFAVFVAEASQRFGIPVAWIRALMRVESANDIRAVSPKGAMGLMQLMPDTWAYLRARYRLGGDPFDPRENIIAGTAYMRELYDRYGAPGFLAAYNTGPGRYDEYLANGRPLPTETRAYVAQLATLVGGKASPALVAVAAADPLAWTRAPLFIGAAERGPGAGPLQADDSRVTARLRLHRAIWRPMRTRPAACSSPVESLQALDDRLTRPSQHGEPQRRLEGVGRENRKHNRTMAG
jgi:hypothetical protein